MTIEKIPQVKALIFFITFRVFLALKKIDQELYHQVFIIILFKLLCFFFKDFIPSHMMIDFINEIQ
jgi:hypothetical protein